MDPIPVCSSCGGFATILAFPSAREVVQSILQLSAGCWLTRKALHRYWYKIHYNLELVRSSVWDASASDVLWVWLSCSPLSWVATCDQSLAVEVKSSQVCTCVCRYVSVFVRYHNTIRSYTYHLTSIITASHVHTFKDMVGWFVVSSVVNLVGDNMLWLCYILMRQ